MILFYFKEESNYTTNGINFRICKVPKTKFHPANGGTNSKKYLINGGFGIWNLDIETWVFD